MTEKANSNDPKLLSKPAAQFRAETPDQSDSITISATRLDKTNSPLNPHQILALQRTIGNHATTRLIAAKPSVSSGLNITPASPYVIQTYRAYPYRENTLVNHANRAHFVAQLNGANTFNNPLIIQLNQANEEVNVIHRLRDTLRAFFAPHPHGNTFGQQLLLKAGIYDINLRDANATFATFRIAVLKPGQNLAQAMNEDQQRLQNVLTYFNPITIEKLLTAQFIQNHVSNRAIPQWESELISAYRERNNTVVVMDATAIANLGAEVRDINHHDAYNAAQHYITRDEYTVIDKFNQQVIRYTTRFQYAVFFNPNDGVWKLHHFQGIHNPSATAVLANLNQRPIEFLAPRRQTQANEANLNVRVRTLPNAINVMLTIDHNPPVAMNAVAGQADTYQYQWNGIALGEHRLLASAQINGRNHDMLRVYTRI